MEAVSRRTFLKDGALVSVAAVAALGWPEFLARAAAAERGLSSERREVYRSLVKAVDAGIGGIDVAAREDEFAAWHARIHPTGQAYAETVLDVLETEPDEGRFSRMPPHAAYRVLESWLKHRTREEREFEASRPRMNVADYPPGASTDEKLAADAAKIREVVAEIEREHGPQAFEQDPETGLVRHQPPPPKAGPRTWPSQLGTKAGRRRFLATDAWNLAIHAPLTPELGVER
jgi:hypothetical protein